MSLEKLEIACGAHNEIAFSRILVVVLVNTRRFVAITIQNVEILVHLRVDHERLRRIRRIQMIQVVEQKRCANAAAPAAHRMIHVMARRWLAVDRVQISLLHQKVVQI